MEADTNEKRERQYYIDWLRIILIVSVFLFHVGMVFNPWEWHVKNDQQFENLKPIMSFLYLWRMPLLFLISGVGTFYALGRRTKGQYLKERFNRLMIPLLAGIFILVPVQVYIEKIDQYNSLWDYYPHMFDGIYPSGNFSCHHLWFIVYLFFISLVISPFLNIIRSKKLNGLMEKFTRIVTKPFGLNIFLIPLLLSQGLLRPYFPEDTHAFINDWAAISYYIIFFLAGFIMLSNKKITEAILQHRFLYLAETVLLTVALFSLPQLAETREISHLIWGITSTMVAWSCSITAIGFTKKHLNFNSNFRKYANEAIYPFYLLHQPVIVVTGFWVVSWEISVLMKAILITASGFSISVLVYWYFVRPFNAMRIIFGMKRIQQKDKMQGNILKPVLLLNKKSQ